MTIHGRQRGSEQYRRKGPADLEAIAKVVKTVTIPVITNGNVRCSYDVAKNMESTGADGFNLPLELVNLPFARDYGS